MARPGRKGTKIDVEHVGSKKAGNGSSTADDPRTGGVDDVDEVLEPEVIEDEEVSGEEVSEKSGSAGSGTKSETGSDDVKSDRKVEPPDDKDLLLQALNAASEARDKYLRLQAEWDNYRKRSNAEREQEKSRAAERMVKDLLPVVDDFERALDHAAKEPDIDSLVAGIEAVHTKLLAVLAKEHVEVIDPKDEAFDATRHQAVGTVDDAEAFDETVRDVYQVGYEMGGKVIRPAMVTITTGGPKRPVEKSEESDGKDEDEKTEV